jgi:glucose uptake protein GlcU
VRRLYLVLSLALLALGAVHTVTALRRLWPFSAGFLTAPAVWFLAGGTAILLAAALNLLNWKYGAGAARGIRPTAVAANLVTFASAILGGVATHATVPQMAVVLSLTGGLTLLSGFESALRAVSPVSRVP